MWYSRKGLEKGSSDSYILKNKNLDIALLQVDSATGAIESVLDIFLPAELPLGCSADGNGIKEWWKNRAIPDSRKGFQQVLDYLGVKTNLSLMLDSYGLSLTDHYWLKPTGEQHTWEELNFYDHAFSEDLGNLLTGLGRLDIDGMVSKVSPSVSVNGEMQKQWVIRGQKRYLRKVSKEYYGQQAVNELIAARLHELSGWKNYVPYTIDPIVIDGREYPCSLSPLFTSADLEFVPAYQLIQNYRIPNDTSGYEAIVSLASRYGMEEQEIRRHLEYTILTDFLLTNTDRHFNNFGFLYNRAEHRLVSAAPVFDTGNALFFDEEVTPDRKDFLNVTVVSFRKKEVEMLRYVKDPHILNLSSLEKFPEEAEKLLNEYSLMPRERAQSIAEGVQIKLEYLKLLQKGKKIWKRIKYW